MVNKSKSRGELAVAALFLFVGVITLCERHASWYGVIQIFGKQATGFGVLCIIISLVILLSYLRR